MITLFFGGSFNSYYNDATSSSFIPLFQRFLYPQWFFYPSLLFPLYAPGEIINMAFQYTQLRNGHRPNNFEIFEAQRNLIEFIPIFVSPEHKFDIINWDLVILTPIIYSFVLFVSSLLIVKIKNK